MRGLEYFHSVRLLPGAWAVVRVDGRGFTRMTLNRFEKPHDERFRDLMVATAERLLEELQGLYAYTESDEVSVLLPPEWSLFDREHEKLVSISAAIASARFTAAFGEVAQFDSRVWLGVNEELVVDYFRWRQEDAARAALNGWAYWSLRRAGRTARAAETALSRRTAEAKKALLAGQGIDYDALPAWQRRGIGLRWERFEKNGYDPIKKRSTTTSRRRVCFDYELPARDDYAQYLLTLTRNR
jgi:tRNA(His) 5'-end guanylyltransferase